MAELEFKECDLCGFSTNTTPDDVAAFGEWMHRRGLTVHYFCLLLSTNLPQRGDDCAGILGFLVRDIRLEIQNALLKNCFYCHKPKASIVCHKCKKNFHLVCGYRYDCAFQFIGEFRSYCRDCTPLDDFQLKMMKDKPPNGSKYCYICRAAMSNYSHAEWIYANCCGNGFVHRTCMRKYALSAGYYLTCIWCRSKQFRDHVRMQGCFVPDRDAHWERDKNAYAELHCGHQRCDVEICHCPKGRSYTTTKWKITVCSLCGSFGVHNPMCIPGHENQKQKVDTFKCDTCRNIAESVSSQPKSTIKQTKKQQQQQQQVQTDHSYGYEIDYTLHINKIPAEKAPVATINETPLFSDDETDTSSVSTATTVLQRLSIIDPNISFVQSASAQKEIEKNLQQKQPVVTQSLDADTNRSAACIARDTSTVAVENWIEIKGWPNFDSDWNCIGSCTLRINLNSPRFARKTIAEICAHSLDENESRIITEADKIEHSTDKGIFKVIDEEIEAFIEENRGKN